MPTKFDKKKKTAPPRPLANEEGVVLVTALLLVAVILLMATYMMQSLGTESSISGSYETNTKSLFVAEGGLEKIKAEIKSGQLSTFSYTGYSFGNSQEFIVNDTSYPLTTLTDPINYVGEGADWYITKNAATLALTGELTVANATWPIYKSVAVGSDYAIISLDRPRWFSSSPTRIVIPMASESNNVQNTSLLSKSVASNMVLEFSNNLLTFQTLRNPADNTTLIDNIANSEVVIGANPAEDHYGSGGDNGIDSGSAVISGVATFTKGNGRTLVIRKCTSGAVGSFTSCDTYPYIIPNMKTENKTFLAGKITNPSTLYYGKLYKDNGTGTASDDYCEDYSALNEADFSVSNNQRYKLDYVSTTSLPGTCDNS